MQHLDSFFKCYNLQRKDFHRDSRLCRSQNMWPLAYFEDSDVFLQRRLTVCVQLWQFLLLQAVLVIIKTVQFYLPRIGWKENAESQSKKRQSWGSLSVSGAEKTSQRLKEDKENQPYCNFLYGLCVWRLLRLLNFKNCHFIFFLSELQCKITRPYSAT